MLQDILDTAKEKMKKSCEVYERDMMGLRAGRANPKLLDRIRRSATFPRRNRGCW